ncbi:hypothetical protein R3W88_031783 [Solanum pinnatisectum]|uniref:Uncharacterized protein n=1 Tax=Solanum pinnatisectum TaxID=50273 RepID=A0AAV9LMD2_9SOLN|nr:hypothetical protein R3W88_031783 [Solanum pinnatisectum]
MFDDKFATTGIVPALSKITDNKLNGVYLLSVEKDDHLIQDPPTDDTKKTWLRDDFVKELMDYLEYLYSGKGNLSKIYEVCKTFYRSEKEANSLTTYFMEEQIAIMSFLAGLPYEFETAKSHILSSFEINSLKDVFSRVLRPKSTLSNQQTNVLVAKGGGGRNNAGRWNNNNDARRWNNNNDVGKRNHNNDVGRWNNNNNSGRWNNNKRGDNDAGRWINYNTCCYCKEPEHIRRNYKKLQICNQQLQIQTATIAATSSSPSIVTILTNEYARLTKYQESMNETTPARALTESSNKCLISSSSN